MIADLRHRLVLEQATRVPDGGGGATETWVPVATVWAAIAEKTGRENEAADRTAPKVIMEITIRHREGVTTDMRFRRGSRHFNIRAALDKDGRRRWLTCTCEEGGGS